MITLTEGKAFFYTMFKLSKMGLIPFQINVEKGRLSKPSWSQTTIWYLSLLLRAAYIAQQLYQMRSIYLLDKNPERATALHVGMAFATPLIFILEVYLSAFEADTFMLVFNELFRTGKFYNPHVITIGFISQIP